MSEANAPSNRPDPTESTNSFWSEQNYSDQQEAFINPFGEMPDVEAEPEASTTSSTSHESIAAGAENWLHPSESTDLADLISLIQELNQCNSILLDRVSQLEEALERSQNALKAEVKRSQDYSFAEYNSGPAIAQDLAAAQEQAIDLYNQLEFVHQTSQRQQILIETLTGQLETSQERVAELERESALVQQRYNEQTQLLAQQESNCRDLQARLHRQQRYTLQFKAALEKSLDVSQYEPVAEVLNAVHSTESGLLPKVQHIEPWTSPLDISPARFPWMKLSSEQRSSDLLQEPVSSTSASETPKAELPFDPADIPAAKPKRSKLAAVKLPGFQPIDAESSSGSNANTETAPPAAIDASTIPDEQLMQKLDAMVQPLADLLAEAVLTEVNSSGAETASEASAPIAPPQSSAVSSTEEITASSAHTSNADDLLNSVMADAEDALWQDLARLIDVSTEDVVKASLSGDLSAFESINFEALQTDTSRNAPSSPVAPQSGVSRSQQADDFAESAPSSDSALPFAASQETIDETNAAANSGSAAPYPTSVFGVTPSWPAPLVYPTRPAKKRRSLAAVDLPSFLQQQPGPLPT